MPQLNAQIIKDNYPEVYQEIYNVGFAAGEVKYRALAEAYRDSLPRTEQGPGPSGTIDMKAESEENKRILANIRLK
jgi:hypothetical protein